MVCLWWKTRGNCWGFSEFDLLELVWEGPGTAEVYRYMSRDVHTIDENADLDTLAERFRTLASAGCLSSRATNSWDHQPP